MSVIAGTGIGVWALVPLTCCAGPMASVVAAHPARPPAMELTARGGGVRAAVIAKATRGRLREVLAQIRAPGPAVSSVQLCSCNFVRPGLGCPAERCTSVARSPIARLLHALAGAGRRLGGGHRVRQAVALRDVEQREALEERHLPGIVARFGGARLLGLGSEAVTKTASVPCSPLRTQPPAASACRNVSQRCAAKPRAIPALHKSRILIPA